MLNQLRIQNFKAWKDTGSIRLAPLTVLFGANSSGKSSLGQLLLALKQTAASADRSCALSTGNETSLVELGTFVECLHKHERNAQLEFTLDWSLPEALEVRNPLDAAQVYAGSALRLRSALAANSQDQPVVASVHYELHAGHETVLSATLRRGAAGDVQLETAPYTLEPAAGCTGPLDPPESFYRVSERSLARYQNAGFLGELGDEVERVLGSISYLGPLREHPRRRYDWAGSTPANVGAKGELAIAAILAAEAAGRTLARGAARESQGFAAFLAKWLVDLGVIESFEIQRSGNEGKDFAVKITTRGGLTQVGLADVGFGISQVLPALVQAFYAPPGSIVWMEQPEIHLHPQVQAELADVFLSAIGAYENGRPRNVQLIVETHSEHFLDRLQRRIAEQRVKPEDIAIHFARAGADGAVLEELLINEYGDISNWPENFFGDEMGDIAARTAAAAQRRAGGAPK